jgi:DNA invertase Pin-like site-specific DNA recombinase
LDLLTNIRELDVAGVRFIAITQGIDIRPGGDAMSRLLLTMLGAISEFERDLIVERTRLGLAKARRLGKRLGRPKVPRPPSVRVRELKRDGRSWNEIAKAFGCTVWAARAAAQQGAR